MEDEVHFGFGTVFVGHGFLAVAKDGGLEFDGTGFVGTVHVSEGGGEHELADAVEGLVDGEHVLRGGIKFFVGDA